MISEKALEYAQVFVDGDIVPETKKQLVAANIQQIMDIRDAKQSGEPTMTMLQGQVLGYEDTAEFELSDVIGAHKEGDVLYVRSNLGETPIIYSTIKVKVACVEREAVEFAQAFVFALAAGHITFDKNNFQGWHNDCDCNICHNQKIIVDYLWPVVSTCDVCGSDYWAFANCPNCRNG